MEDGPPKRSHCHFRHPDRPGTVTVPHPKSEMGIGTIKSIEKQSDEGLVAAIDRVASNRSGFLAEAARDALERRRNAA